MFTSETAKLARSKVSSKSCSDNGKKGYQALVACGKEHIAAQKAAEWRLNHPTNLEQQVMSWLDELNVEYEREVSIDRYYADFVVECLVIEVNGAQWHEKEDLRDGQKDRDKSKYRTLMSLGYTILILPESDIKNGDAKVKLERLFKNA